MKKKAELDLLRLERANIAKADFEEYIKLVQPKRLLGNIHRRVIQWWEREDAKSHQLVLLPRDHMKSALIALRASYHLTRDPTLRILLISSTSLLATKQLKFIKDIMTSDNYRIHFPDMIHQEEAKREKWTEREISVDHPLRREWSIRDPSIFTAGLTSNIVGLHCDIAILDDVVVSNNAYTEEGREKVKEQYGYLSSVEGTGAKEWVVGTRYHPQDLYSDLLKMELEDYDELGNVRKREPLFETIEEQVESVGDGTGEFLWPRSQGPEGKWFGFDRDILAVKKSQYRNQLHFRAQYYNDPHDVDSSPIKRDLFQYYDAGFLHQRDGRWFFKGERLNVFAAIDFAYSLGLKSDFTAIVVVGVDARMNYYILDIDRFKTDKASEYFNRILKLYEKWGFRKLRAEISAAQVVIVKDLKENYIRPLGLSFSIDEYKPSMKQGSKEERIMTILEPKYANHQIWHGATGNFQLLEEELMMRNPAHDDIKDALASVIDLAVAPLDLYKLKKESHNGFNFHSRWGGVT